jgi:hypothetical protein
MHKKTLYSVLVLVIVIGSAFLLVSRESSEIEIPEVEKFVPSVLHEANNNVFNIIEKKEDTITLLNSSGSDNFFRTTFRDGDLDIFIPKDIEFEVYSYAPSKLVGIKAPNGLSIEFEYGLDGPWNECSYGGNEDEGVECESKDIAIDGVFFNQISSTKPTKKLLELYALPNALPYSNIIEDVRISTEDYRQLNDADKLIISKILKNTRAVQ